MLGTEFERSTDREMVARVIMRLAAVFGDPWGRDERSAKVMRSEWELALSDMPAVVIDSAVTEWTRSQTKWPRPADIRSIADRLLRAPIEAAAQKHGLHPKRIEPDESMKGFTYSDSPLRRYPKWAQWLNAQHPTLEHFFFRKCDCVAPHELFGFSEFEAERIKQEHGHSLTAHFGRAVALGIGPRPCREVIWTDEPYRAPTDEERQRVSKAVGDFLKRARGESNSEIKPKSGGRGANLDGASPEFLSLIGAEAPPAQGVTESPASNTNAIDSRSPHAASRDLDAAE